MSNFKTPTTISQALALVDYTLIGAHHLKVGALLSGTFSTDTERVQHLSELGGLAVAATELETFMPAFNLLRSQCRKPTAATYELVRVLLAAEASPLSAITSGVVDCLPELAAAVAREQATHDYKPDETYPKRDRDLHPRRLTATEMDQKVATAREQATATKALLAKLPSALARVRELAEAEADLTQAGAWLN